MNGPASGAKMSNKAQSRNAAPMRSQNPARGYASGIGTLGRVGGSIAGGAVAVIASPSPAVASKPVAGAAAIVVAIVPEGGGPGADGVCRRSRRIRPNMAVTAAPNPHKLVTPSVINPRTGTM